MSVSCLMVGAAMFMLPSGQFTLEWTHSIEKTVWREDWIIEDDRLRLTQAAIKGSGAGMEPGDGAILRQGWWVWTPELAPVPDLLLAASGATGAGWRVCAKSGECLEIGEDAGRPQLLRACPDT